MGVMTQTLPLFVVSTLKVTFNRLKILFASLEKYSYRHCDRSCYAWMGGRAGGVLPKILDRGVLQRFKNPNAIKDKGSEN